MAMVDVGPANMQIGRLAWFDRSVAIWRCLEGYICQMNWVNSRSDFITMTAPEHRPSIIIIIIIIIFIPWGKNPRG